MLFCLDLYRICTLCGTRFHVFPTTVPRNSAGWTTLNNLEQRWTPKTVDAAQLTRYGHAKKNLPQNLPTLRKRIHRLHIGDSLLLAPMLRTCRQAPQEKRPAQIHHQGSTRTPAPSPARQEFPDTHRCRQTDANLTHHSLPHH